jgi:hypothetical protein
MPDSPYYQENLWLNALPAAKQKDFFVRQEM